jgi:allantoate deiminase
MGESSVNREPGVEIMRRADALATASESCEYLLRRYLTSAYRAALDMLKAWMLDAGMTVRTDSLGNIIGRYEAATPDQPALLFGSHVDTVRDAGKYDGTLGVLIGIAAVEALHRRNERLPFAVEVIGFGDEEGVRFGTTFLGSRGIAGTFDPELLNQLDDDGVSLAEAMRAFDLDPNDYAEAAYRPSDVLGYYEIHIEQGPVLENLEIPVGVVSAIAGQTRMRVKLEGEAGHAGTVPMSLRRDALAGAASIVSHIESVCANADGVVGTVGILQVTPGAINGIGGGPDSPSMYVPPRTRIARHRCRPTFAQRSNNAELSRTSCRAGPDMTPWRWLH